VGIKTCAFIFRYIRVEHYRYVFTKIGSKDAKLGRWWKRRHIGNYLPPISLDSVKDFMKNMDYEFPRIRRKRKLWSQFVVSALFWISVVSFLYTCLKMGHIMVQWCNMAIHLSFCLSVDSGFSILFLISSWYLQFSRHVFVSISIGFGKISYHSYFSRCFAPLFENRCMSVAEL
jgi:hypothetical protein